MFGLWPSLLKQLKPEPAPPHSHGYVPLAKGILHQQHVILVSYDRIILFSLVW